MRINQSAYTVSELLASLERRDLRINRDYQRGEGVWPPSAKTYFLDTILEEYPFPKLYFYQIYDQARRRPVMEVVDGQQRLMTIKEFVEGNFRLTSSSKNYEGMTFSDLDEEKSQLFLMTSVPVDVILAVERSKLLEMFRRMNAYTAPLNNSEKRHSKFQGQFKWFAVELADQIGSILSEFGILTSKQMVRMADSEMIAEFSLVLRNGITSKAEKDLDKIYKDFDDDFPHLDEYKRIILGFFEFLNHNFKEIRTQFLMKPYAIYSLFCAYAHIAVGIPGGDTDVGVVDRRRNPNITPRMGEQFQEISDAHETKNIGGIWGQYVAAALSTTTKKVQRSARAAAFFRVLNS